MADDPKNLTTLEIVKRISYSKGQVQFIQAQMLKSWDSR